MRLQQSYGTRNLSDVRVGRQVTDLGNARRHDRRPDDPPAAIMKETRKPEPLSLVSEICRESGSDPGVSHVAEKFDPSTYTLVDLFGKSPLTDYAGS